MTAIWDEQQAAGRTPRSAEEVTAEINAMRDEWEDRQQSLEQLEDRAPTSGAILCFSSMTPG
jgi:hypothetical protein